MFDKNIAYLVKGIIFIQIKYFLLKLQFGNIYWTTVWEPSSFIMQIDLLE